MYRSIFFVVCVAVAFQLINHIGVIQYLATLILLLGYTLTYIMCLWNKAYLGIYYNVYELISTGVRHCHIKHRFALQQVTCFHATWSRTPKTTNSVACDKMLGMTWIGPVTQEERLRV